MKKIRRQGEYLVLSKVKEECLQAILDSDRDTANALIDDWINMHGYDGILTEILDPILIELGELWTIQKDITFAQVYVSATIAEDIIVKVLENTDGDEKGPKKDTIILGNIEDDFHSLGRRLVGTFLTSFNWDVVDMGNDTTAEEFVDMAVEKEAKIIMVSAMMYTTAKNIQSVRDEIDKRGLRGKILLAVGGAIFNLRPDLWESVGADGMSKNALEASELATTMLDQMEV